MITCERALRIVRTKSSDPPDALPDYVGFSARNASRRFANETSDRNVSEPVLEIKVPSNVDCDTPQRGVATKLQIGGVLQGRQHRSAPLRKVGASCVASWILTVHPWGTAGEFGILRAWQANSRWRFRQSLECCPAWRAAADAPDRRVAASERVDAAVAW